MKETQVSKFGERFILGDKVMQIVNNYDKDVFNGNIGIIQHIDLDTVNINEKAIKYELDELDQLTLAYATTVHKAQGSEYPVVIISLVTSHSFMLQKALLQIGYKDKGRERERRN